VLWLAMIVIHAEILAEIESKSGTVYARRGQSPIHDSDDPDAPKVFALHLHQVALQFLIATLLRPQIKRNSGYLIH
jgi:hypothetical protein